MVGQDQGLREATGHPDNGAPRLRQRTGHGSRADRRGQRRFTGARGYRQSQLATGESLEPVEQAGFPRPQGEQVADTLTLRGDQLRAPPRQVGREHRRQGSGLPHVYAPGVVQRAPPIAPADRR